MSDIQSLRTEFTKKIKEKINKQELDSIKTELFGKNGKIPSLFKSLGNLSASQKKEFASNLNLLKDDLISLINKKFSDLEIQEINNKLKNEKIDVTLPGRTYFNGKIHPVSQVIDEVTSIFSEIGFSVEEGPDVENEYYNFSALNTPENHPARDMHDTFYLDHSKDLLLRTHTSPVQIRTMLKSKPPFKIIAPGRTYRCDSDQTHSPMFHQLEGLHIDRDINMGHLKGCLYYFVKKFFEVDKIKVRFTEPCYIGKSSEDERHIKLKQIRDSNVKDDMIGYFDGFKYTRKFDKKMTNILPFIAKANTTLCFNWPGQEEHLTSRYNEALGCDVIPLVWKDYDCNNQLVVSDWQRCYSFEDVQKKCLEVQDNQVRLLKLKEIKDKYSLVVKDLEYYENLLNKKMDDVLYD